jgi:hypothetical protein
MAKHAKKASDTFDWSRADAMTGEQIHAAALVDPDAQGINHDAALRHEHGAAKGARLGMPVLRW